MISKALEREGFFVLAANSGAKAISLFRSYPGDVDLLLSDGRDAGHGWRHSGA